MDLRKHQPSPPLRGQDGGSGFRRLCRSVLLRVFLILCVGLYPVSASKAHQTDVHHPGSIIRNAVGMQGAPDSHRDGHEEHPESGCKGHSHRCAGCAATCAVIPETDEIQMNLIGNGFPSFDNRCPEGPAFELIKPPLVA